MSHFTVMIIGENPEDQLEPYSEQIEMERYSEGPVSEESMQSFINTYTTYEPERGYAELTEEEVKINQSLSIDDLIEKYMEDWGTDWEKIDGVWYNFSTYNPKSKWDWYQLGGIWTGMLKLKPLKLIGGDTGFNDLGLSGGEMNNLVKLYLENEDKFYKTVKKYNGLSALITVKVKELVENAEIYPEHEVGEPGLMCEKAERGYADSCLKKDIDVQFMRDKAAELAAKTYDYVTSFISNYPKAKSWEEIQKEYEDISVAREVYWNQPLMKAWQIEEHPKDVNVGWSVSPSDFSISREEYLQNASDQAIMTFAILKDGQWIEKGEMGWWGCVSGEKDKKSWNREFNELFESLPDDTLISIYDCHI